MLFGYKVKVELGLYWFVNAKGAANLGMTNITKEWAENPQLRDSKTTYGNPATFSIEGTVGLNPKAVIKVPGISAEASAKSSAKSSAKLKIFEINLKTENVRCPLYEEGIPLEINPITKFDIFGLSWSHEWGKYEYTITFKDEKQ